MKTTEQNVTEAALARRPKAVLAQRLQVAPGLITRWSTGSSTPTPEQLAQLQAIVDEPEPGAESAVEGVVQPPVDDEIEVTEAPKAPPSFAEKFAESHDAETGQPLADAPPAKALPEARPFRCEVNVKACSVSEKTVALGVEVSRSALDLAAADAALVAARIAVVLSVGDGQAALFEGADDDVPAKVDSVADVSKISVGQSTIGFRLSFRRESVDLDAVAAYAGKTATLDVKRVGVAGEEEKPEPDEGVFASGDPT